MKNEKDNPNKRLCYAIIIYAVVFLLTVCGILIYKLSSRKDFDFDDYSFPEDTVVSTKADVSSVESVSSLENSSSSTPQGLDPKFSKLLEKKVFVKLKAILLKRFLQTKALLLQRAVEQF